MYFETPIKAHQPLAAPGAGRMVSLTPRVSLPGFAMSFARNEEIFGEEEPADFVYKVVSGAVRTTRLLSDGRRQIGAFHLAGDVFGLERGETHRFSAEALTNSEIILVRRAALDRAAEQDCAVARELWALTSRDLERVEDHMLVLSRKNAAERVASFLLKLADRGGSANVIELPMSRSDIADHLGLTIETVSRTLTQFERDAVISLPSTRRVLVNNRAALTSV
jgi:CRP/FNR family nitrogen fixation transcriptional regulator